MISLSDIKPVCLHLAVDDYWKQRMFLGAQHFEEEGLENIMWVQAIHAERFGVEAARVYDRDPQNIETGWRVPQRTVGNFLSWYTAFVVMKSHPEIDYWLITEDDTRMRDGWRARAEQALKDVPEDFDFLLLSHCCTEGKETTHIKGEVYEVKYPQAGHISIIAKKALPIILDNATNASYPMDVCFHDFVFPKLKVYTVLPRLADQVDTVMPT